MRERRAEIERVLTDMVRVTQKFALGKSEQPAYIDKYADSIQHITNPVLTVKVQCDKCGRSGCITSIEECLDGNYDRMGCSGSSACIGATDCPHCTNGQVEREVEWHVEIDMGAQLNDGTWATEHDSKPLHLADLRDPDVAYGYWMIQAHKYGKVSQCTLPHNKGTLTIKGEG
jgi:hypothetical protein